MPERSETGASPGPADIIAAHRIVEDLITPNPWCYWRELVLTGSAAWFAILVAILADSWIVTGVAGLFAVLLWYRAAAMIHELTHQQRYDELPGFHLAWNFLIGVPWLLPSVMYEGVHNGHHKKSTYGTSADPEYLSLAGRPGEIARYLAFSFVAFPGLLVR